MLAVMEMWQAEYRLGFGLAWKAACSHATEELKRCQQGHSVQPDQVSIDQGLLIAGAVYRFAQSECEVRLSVARGRYGQPTARFHFYSSPPAEYLLRSNGRLPSLLSPSPAACSETYLASFLDTARHP